MLHAAFPPFVATHKSNGDLVSHGDLFKVAFWDFDGDEPVLTVGQIEYGLAFGDR